MSPVVSKGLEWARQWIQDSAAAVSDNRELLIELDRQIGDGDHGENLDRGFTAVVRGGGVQEAERTDDLLKYVAKTLLSTVGGAAGPLYGAAYLKAAQAAPQRDLRPADIADLLEAAAQGVQARGKATAGEKTMLDALLPAAVAAREAAVEGDFASTWNAAAEAAEAGAEATKPMKATKGRASYLGERSRGHLDPGAVSTAMLIRAAADAASRVHDNE